jgi:hypothetical protein
LVSTTKWSDNLDFVSHYLSITSECVGDFQAELLNSSPGIAGVHFVPYFGLPDGEQYVTSCICISIAKILPKKKEALGHGT